MNIKKLDLKTPNNTRNSPINPDVKGKPIFPKINIIKKKDSFGIVAERFLITVMSYVLNLLKIIPAQKKRPEEIKQWLNIIKTLPNIPTNWLEKKPKIPKFICIIDEYAIIFFKCVSLNKIKHE